MRTIHKFEIPNDRAPHAIELQRPAMPIACSYQPWNGQWVLWAVVDTDSPDRVQRRFQWFNTGEKIPMRGMIEHVGTVQLDDKPYVAHLLEVF